MEGPHGLEDPTALVASVRAALTSLASPVRRVHLQLVPSHCGIDGNERADSVAWEAAAFLQEHVTVDVLTAHRAAARADRQWAIASQPDTLYRSLMEDQMLPPPPPSWSMATAHRRLMFISSAPVTGLGLKSTYIGCGGTLPKNVGSLRYLLHCGPVHRVPWRGRHQVTRPLPMPGPHGTAPSAAPHNTPEPQEVLEDGDVAVLAAAIWSFQSRSATPR